MLQLLMPNSLTAPITKSQFKLGLDCIQKLQHTRNRLPQVSQENEMLRLLAEGGSAVEALIRATEPGRFIGGFKDAALAESSEAIADALNAAAAGKTTSLYEVTIAHGGFLARIDLLRIRPEAIDLVEIKSKSVEGVGGQVDQEEFRKQKGGIRAEWMAYIQDLAFQRELLIRYLAEIGQQTGVSIRQAVRPRLLLVNKLGVATPATALNRANYRSTYQQNARGIHATVDFIGQEADRSLLVEVPMEDMVAVLIKDAGSDVIGFKGLGIADCMQAMKGIVDSDQWPDAHQSLGKTCKSCEFRVRTGLESGFDKCWENTGGCSQHHLLTTILLSEKQFAQALSDAGTKAGVLDIAEESIKDTQRKQYESIQRSSPLVTRSFANDPMGQLFGTIPEGPVYFIDFETAAYPIPSRVGGHPNEQIPFQFEGHRIPSPTAGLETRVQLDGFLDLEQPSPHRAFIDGLKSQVGDSGPIFHWHNFENTILRKIRGVLEKSPEPGDEARMAFIDALTGSVGQTKGRLIDLLPIAKSAFYHPDMAGSYSIKKVVPIAWGIPAIRDHFILGHGATSDPSHYSGTKDPYDGLPSPPRSILEAVGGIETYRTLVEAEDDEGPSALRNGGMAMLAYHYVRMFGGADDPAIVSQFRQYCQLDSAAMVMVYALMRDQLSAWSKFRE